MKLSIRAPSIRPRRRVLIGAILLHLAPVLGLQAQHDSSTALPIPTEWRTYHLVLLERDSSYRAASDSADQAVLQAHIQYQLRAQREGSAIAAGPFTPAEGSRLAGMTLLRTDSAGVAERWAAADPAVRAGRFRATVRAWTTPDGRIP